MDFLQALERQQALAAHIKQLQAEERELRIALFNGTFPHAHEGVNDYTLPDGRVIKGTLKIDRSIVESDWAGLNAKQLMTLFDSGAFKHKPTFVLPKYRELSGDLLVLADSVLSIKPGMPSLEIKER